MAKIMIGIPSIRNDQNFMSSMSEFIPALSKIHNLCVIEVREKKIDEARNLIVDMFMSKDYDYLLFLDDDHSGHKVEMISALLKPLEENKEYVCAIKCYSRIFPHVPTLMDYSGVEDNLERLGLDGKRGKYITKENKDGYAYCNLVGFGMTLIRKEVFNILNKPYFIGENNQREDNYFCDRLQHYGIQPVGCFDYTLPHNGIDESNFQKLNDSITNEIKESLIKNCPEYHGQDITIVA